MYNKVFSMANIRSNQCFSKCGWQTTVTCS